MPRLVIIYRNIQSMKLPNTIFSELFNRTPLLLFVEEFSYGAMNARMRMLGHSIDNMTQEKCCDVFYYGL